MSVGMALYQTTVLWCGGPILDTQAAHQTQTIVFRDLMAHSTSLNMPESCFQLWQSRTKPSFQGLHCIFGYPLVSLHAACGWRIKATRASRLSRAFV